MAVATQSGLRGAAPALAPDERVPPTPEEARRLALAITEANPDLAALIFVDATTGMRRGEICGLRFCDIDTDAGQRRSGGAAPTCRRAKAASLEAEPTCVKVFPNGVVMLSATKNKKRRRFALDPITLAVIADQKARAEVRMRGARGRARSRGLRLVPESRPLGAVAT